MGIYSGLGQMLSDSSKNSSAIDEFAKRKALEMRTPTDDYHRAMAKKQVMDMADRGEINLTNDRTTGAYLQDAYLRSKTNGAVGLDARSFNDRTVLNNFVSAPAQARYQNLVDPNVRHLGNKDIKDKVYPNNGNQNKIVEYTDDADNSIDAMRLANSLNGGRSGGSGNGIKSKDVSITFKSKPTPINDKITDAIIKNSNKKFDANSFKKSLSKIGINIGDDEFNEIYKKAIIENSGNLPTYKELMDLITSNNGIVGNDVALNTKIANLGGSGRSKVTIKVGGNSIDAEGFTANGEDYVIYKNEIIKASELRDYLEKTQTLNYQGTNTIPTELNNYKKNIDITTGLSFENKDELDSLKNKKNSGNKLNNLEKSKLNIFNYVKGINKGTNQNEVYNTLDKFFGENFKNSNIELLTTLGFKHNPLFNILSSVIYGDKVEGNYYKSTFEKTTEKLIPKLGKLDKIYQNAYNNVKNTDEFKNLTTTGSELYLDKTRMYSNEVSKLKRKKLLDNPNFKKVYNKKTNLVSKLSGLKVFPTDTELTQDGTTIKYRSTDSDPLSITAYVNKHNGSNVDEVKIDLSTKNTIMNSLKNFYNKVYYDNPKHVEYLLNELGGTNFKGVLQDKVQ